MTRVTEATATAATSVTGVTEDTSHSIRIPHLLARLERYWMQNPELRLGQIVGNIATVEGADPYYVDDEVLVTHLEQMAPNWE